MVDLNDIERRLDALIGKPGEPTLEELEAMTARLRERIKRAKGARQTETKGLGGSGQRIQKGMLIYK